MNNSTFSHNQYVTYPWLQGQVSGILMHILIHKYLFAGEIIRYDLFHNEVPVYSGMRMYYDIGGLLPYSLHAFRVVACTREGCGSSVLVKARTQEAKPEGFVIMELRVEDPRTVSVKWTVPEQPNGNMMFDVYFEGLFYADIGKF